MPYFTPERSRPCPSCQKEVKGKVERNFTLFAEVDTTVSCPQCKSRLRWRSQPFVYQDIGLILFACSLLLVEFPGAAVPVLLCAMVLFFYGESSMGFESKGGADGRRANR